MLEAENGRLKRLLAEALLEHEVTGEALLKKYVQQLRQKAEPPIIRDHVEFRGLLDEAELRRELGRCAALVLPSYQETAPLVIAEAIAVGVPVIASDVGGIRYQVRDGKTGCLLAPGEVDGMAHDRCVSRRPALSANSPISTLSHCGDLIMNPVTMPPGCLLLYWDSVIWTFAVQLA